ncbi:MAG TPA: GNAT family N-acetyltransferase [Sphingomicrobium sp.]|jgi:ribosomal protein S18 acetylase RimI-like enzyme|nr:GNAT family N-acetyltransferase [Sphingomicrobium sp.]
MIEYRDAEVADAPALDRLFDTSFCDTFGHLYGPEDLEEFLTSFSIADWEEHLGDPAFLFRIAQADGVPVGYLKLGPLKLPVEPEGPALLLDQLYVLAEHHGTGIAPALMDWAITEARRRGAEELYLTVYVDNHRARRFYERYGFEAVGRYDFMVGNHADEDVIMRKKL